jgi:putative ABC transport system permease protein
VLATLLAIALGVALGAAVYLVNSAALNAFDQATRRLMGVADVIVRGPPEGFDEGLFVELARNAAVSEASPLLELQLTLTGSRPPLKVLGVDPFRAAALQPSLMAELGADVTQLFRHDAIVLSSAAARLLQLRRGDSLPVVVGGTVKSLRVIDILSDNAYPEPLGIMDIGAAQWTLDRLGRLNRIDLRLRAGMDASTFRTRLAVPLPAGVVTLTPQLERGRAANATRAYRVNLDMLALVALLTGTFVVFSTQSLSVLQRRTALGLLRALGVTRGELRRALLLEGAAIGAAGSVVGVLLGALGAALVLHFLGADLGARTYAAVGGALALHPASIMLFLVLGTAAAGAGAWIPAQRAAQLAPALVLRAGDVDAGLSRLPRVLSGSVLILAGAVLAWLPPLDNLPLPGYLAIAALLAGAIMQVPALMQALVGAVPRTGQVVMDTAVAQLQGSIGLSSLSLASIITSFSLMVAMAIMVHSFRGSFDVWLVKLLPADLQLRRSVGSDTAVFSAEEQARIAALPAIAGVQFRRVRQVYLRPESAPVTLIARDIAAGAAADVLPLLGADHAAPSGAQPVWISEALQDLYGYRPGERIDVPLEGRNVVCFIAGVWRDYTRPSGAVVISRQAYVAATGDHTATEASVWRRPQIKVEAVEAAIRAQLRDGAALDMTSTPELRERSLMIFDRAFAITYALEAIAVLIGLVGISIAASSTALARRAQFGMLRHVGMLRRQVLAMLACEGIVLSTFAVIYGLLLGGTLSLILIYVVNRQSFHWSIDLAVPWWQLGALSSTLIVASALTALLSGRAATSQAAIRAVREDW